MMITKERLKICWLSAGVSSFMAGYLAKNVDEFIYIDVENQHPDSMRFIRDCEKVLNRPIQILKSEYGNVDNVIKTFRFISSPYGAKCTEVLKKRVRKVWEYEHQDFEITYIWGFDLSEKRRAERTVNGMPQFNHEFPLIDKSLAKQDVHGLFTRMFGFARPYMYDLGYPNNNCIGCVKGGMGYWNRIRKDFPEVFETRAKLERDIGHSCINGIFLDELELDRGNMNMEIFPECSIMCYLVN